MEPPDIHEPAQIEALVLGAVESFGVPRDRITQSAQLDELGLDPLDLTELCHLLEEQCGVPVTTEDLDSCVAIDDVVEFVARKSSRT